MMGQWRLLLLLLLLGSLLLRAGIVPRLDDH